MANTFLKKFVALLPTEHCAPVHPADSSLTPKIPDSPRAENSDGRLMASIAKLLTVPGMLAFIHDLLMEQPQDPMDFVCCMCGTYKCFLSALHAHSYLPTLPLPLASLSLFQMDYSDRDMDDKQRRALFALFRKAEVLQSGVGAIVAPGWSEPLSQRILPSAADGAQCRPFRS